jgi:hypothetical protein
MLNLCSMQQYKFLGLHVRYFCPILTKFVISRQILTKICGDKFNRNLCSGSRTDAWRRTDEHDDANRPFLRVFERA